VEKILMVRLLIADDHPLVLIGIRSLLRADPEIEILAEANDGLQALEMVRDLNPDVLLLDMEMPRMGGVAVARQLSQEKHPVRILALSAHSDRHYVQSILECGASGYLLKDEVPDIIIKAIHSVAEGEQGWISRKAMSCMIGQREERVNIDMLKLTRRNLEVLRNVANGMTNQEIALSLGISEKTVEKHLRKAFSKLGVVSRVEAAVLITRFKL
jgi:DNA-binding NarL/FixJ family response regulator